MIAISCCYEWSRINHIIRNANSDHYRMSRFVFSSESHRLPPLFFFCLRLSRLPFADSLNDKSFFMRSKLRVQFVTVSFIPHLFFFLFFFVLQTNAVLQECISRGLQLKKKNIFITGYEMNPLQCFGLSGHQEFQTGGCLCCQSKAE